jgi:ATP-binding cassette subfamily B protein
VALFVTLACFSGSILAIISFFTIVNIFWIFYFLKRRKEIDYARFYNRGHNQDNINEIILGMQDIKLNDLESYKLNNWYRTQEEQNMLSLKMMKVDQRQLIGSSSLNQLENIIISFFSALAVIKGNMTLGMMMSINLITGQLKGAITQFLYLTQAFQEASISLDRLMEIHNNKNEDEGSKGLTLTGSNIYSLELKNVSFKYASEGEFILKNISMTIPIGKTIAIVGGSGSGKTTLMKVLLKYHDAIEGSVVINKAIDLHEISSKWWWQQCGVVMQEGFIFSDTIDNNIAVIVSEDEMEKMKTAKKIANVYDFIESMPDNGKTKIGATGNGISGGQKQRLLIARALYKNPEMLFFDEATSSLDSENEELIMQNIERQFNGKTKVIIAHRYSTIKNADIIFVLDKGEIVETGTHEQLMTKMGQYHKLFSSQMVAEKLTNDSAVV